jgi:DNA-binding Lrp family transcriptional regulator
MRICGWQLNNQIYAVYSIYQGNPFELLLRGMLLRRDKNIELKLISEFMKNSKRSDRELAKAIGVSQPTITRARTRLEKEELLYYTTIPDFGKLGFEIMALSFYRWRTEANEELIMNRDAILEKLATFLSNHKNIIFTANGQGFGMERMMISVHKSYTDYSRLMDAVRREWGKYLAQTNSFVISLDSDVIGRTLTLNHLAEYLLVEP